MISNLETSKDGADFSKIYGRELGQLGLDKAFAAPIDEGGSERESGNTASEEVTGTGLRSPPDKTTSANGKKKKKKKVKRGST